MRIPGRLTTFEGTRTGVDNIRQEALTLGIERTAPLPEHSAIGRRSGPPSATPLTAMPGASPRRVASTGETVAPRLPTRRATRIEVLVDGVRCVGELRMWSQRADGSWQCDVVAAEWGADPMSGHVRG